MESPLITVIVPVYNVEPYLPRCIDSVLSQSYRNIEVLVVDDGSTDGSPSLCDYYAEHDDRVRVVHEPNRGLSEARNTALNLMRGSLVTMVDGDDWLAPEALTTLSEAIVAHDADVAVGRWQLVPDGENPAPPASPTRPAKVFTRDEAIDEVFYQGVLTNSSCSRLFKSEIFQSLRYEPGLLYEDLALVYDILLQTQRVVYTPALVYYYRQRPDSITGLFTPRRAQVVRILKDLEQRVAVEAPRHLPAVRSRLLSACFNILLLCPQDDEMTRSIASRCWQGIRRLRLRCLIDPRVRSKNKLGILASFAGKRLFLTVFGNKGVEK